MMCDDEGKDHENEFDFAGIFAILTLLLKFFRGKRK